MTDITSMKKIGAIIMKRHLQVYKKHLDAANLLYEQNPGPTEDSILIRVFCNFIGDGMPVLEGAAKECQNADF